MSAVPHPHGRGDGPGENREDGTGESHGDGPGDSRGPGDGRAAATAAELPEPVRARLVRIAADLVAALPAEEVPAALRRVAQFTPNKRERLGGAALVQQLEADADFRERAAEAVRTARPALAETLEAGPEGLAAAAADPLDVVAALAVLRPDGWQDAASALVHRWRAGRAELDDLAERLAEAKQELTELRRQVRVASGRLADAQERAEQRERADRTDETARLRSLLRERGAELRAARDELANLRAQPVDAGSASPSPGEVEGLRRRVADLERELDAARRGRREQRSRLAVDEARLRVLLDTLVGAATGLRRELDLPAGPTRPADTVADPDGSSGTQDAAGPGRAVRDLADLQEVIRAPGLHVLVDGYNVTKTAYPTLPLVDQRARLLRGLAALHARARVEVTAVFDGAPDGAARPPVRERAPRGVRLRFSAAGQIADDLIRALVDAEPAGRPLLVVSSDRAVADDVCRKGAWTAGSALFAELLG